VCWAEETSIRLADRVNRDAEETAIIVKPKSRMVKLDSETAADTASTGSGAAGDGGDGEGGVGGGCAADGDWFPNTKAQDRGLAALGLGGWRDRANANMVAFLSETDLEARAPEAFHVTYIAGNRTAPLSPPPDPWFPHSPSSFLFRGLCGMVCSRALTCFFSPWDLYNFSATIL